ncbi:ubiquitin carboxyl-terminal hydrolase 25 [Euphorbia lathyris]|uniref:ubiquitin carboxyl-terminal hydrolase 25 n=1 Tax=Euphorbia lathyris TaxID=212925 RepID=UPI0033131D1F
MGLQLQMSWQPNLLSQKRKNGPPLGLKNLGNSCYLNSVLQCLTYTPPLANFCLRLQHSSLCDSLSNGERKRECPFCILEKRIVRSLSMDLTLDTPAKIQSCLRIFAEHFRCGRQEDAHEFLRYVIDSCHNTCLRLMKLKRKGNDSINGSDTVVKEIFGGALQSQVKCLSCHSESNKVDEIMDISLDVLHTNSLKEAMQKFFQPETLDGSNKYRCENCKKLVAAKKQMSILQAPNVLVIQLKRFEGIFGGKIDKAIAFEEVLVLSSFMCKGSQDLGPEYNLFGTIVHSGYSPESGHYYAYIKDAMGRWYCCNDSYVTLSTLQDVLSEKVYILFFSRTNQRPVSATATFHANGVQSRHSNGNDTSKVVKNAVELKAVPAKLSAEPLFRKDTSSTFHANGVQSCHSNGNGASKVVKNAVQPKAVPAKLSVEPVFQKDMPSMSKVDKMPCGQRLKFNIPGNFGLKKNPPTIDRKADTHKLQNSKVNGDVKEPACLEKVDKEVSSVMNGNGCNKHNKVDDSLTFRTSVVANENGRAQNGTSDSVRTNAYEASGTIGGKVTERELNPYKLQNEVKHHAELKRKLKDESFILFAQDAQSRAKVEELKEVLEQEASSVLRSCGWSDNVYSFMHSRKRSCARLAGNIDLKEILMTEAKASFIPEIPESLKEDLVKRLQSFGEEK